MSRRERARRVLLVGNGGFYHVGAFFRRALADLGYESRFLDEARYFGARRGFLYRAVARGAGADPLAYRRFNGALLRLARELRPRVVLVVKGAYVHEEALAAVKDETQAVLINYATDDPFNQASSTRHMVSAIPVYDLYCTTRRAVIPDLRRHGSREVAYVPFAYEPALHFPERPRGRAETARWTSDLMFAGGCDRDRARFFTSLARRVDLDLRLYGGYWDRQRELRRFWHGFALGREYRVALGCTKCAPCLVRRGNRDGHVMRTFEIPACGAFMLAERTEEHLELFEEEREAVCFGSPEELADKALYYLAREEKRQRIADAGHCRVTSGGHTYRDRLLQILRIADSF